MKIVRIILNVILAFVLMLAILASTVLYIANRYTNKEYLISKFEEIDIYTQIYQEVKEGFEEYIYQSGLDVSILDKICDREKIKQDMLLVVDSIYSGKEAKIDTSSIRTNLDNEINKFVSSQNRKLSKQEKENITKFEDLIITSYEKQFSIYKKIQEKFSKNIKEIIEILSFMKNIAITASVALIIILILINIKNIFSAVGYIGTSFLSSGVILALIEKIINGRITIDNLVLFSKSMSNMLIYTIKEFLSSISEFGMVYVCIGLIVIVLSAIKNKI